MSFKDDMIGDLDVFFNQDEFAEAVEINGVKVCVVKDTFDLDPFNSPERKTPYQGAAKRVQKIFIKTPEVPEGVFMNASIKIDGVSWKVESKNENGGVTELLLSSVEAR